MKTPLGFATVKGDANGIASVSVSDDHDLVPDEVIPEVLQDAVYQLEEYFRGKRKSFSIALNPEGTEFQKKVWDALLAIPYGKTVSYLELSRRLGDEKAIRAIAGANAKNPVWIIIPCHRVIGSDGSLTGYAGGLWRKQWLLEHENPPSQLKLL
ncbi:MAG: methylated-DNA--[protein]-cysteine S-methyltransferase [Sinomicrobium sp.]|nr:methylated-DNA--[protein]-cysteine S-methyltransferase [Sinomicrobium sp.]